MNATATTSTFNPSNKEFTVQPTTSSITSSAAIIHRQTHDIGPQYGTHTVALALNLGEERWASLCCWCAPEDAEVHRLGLTGERGGECARCSYVGRDCLVVRC